jgi:CubicO group peptidase (beta-lactamase class C family)
MTAVDGTTKPGFEPLADALAAGDLGRGGGAFAAYVEGELVADLWAGEAAPGTPWQPDTLTTAYSATKGAAALCILLLHDRGLLDVEAPVSKYWPEYAQAGKEKTLVRHLLNHTSGMLCFQDPGSILDWSGGGWDDYDGIARGIATSPPAWEPGTRIAYHAISVGWLCQELVRRTTGMTLGTFFAKEVAAPLGLDIFIGTPEAEQQRLAAAISDPPAPATPELEELLEQLRAVMRDPTTRLAQSAIFMHGGSIYENMDFLTLPRSRSAEIPAANGTMDARSLARMYAALAEAGELDGVRLASKESIGLFGTLSFSGPSAVADMPWLAALLGGPAELRYALGFEGDFGIAPKPWRFGPTPTTFGHLGAGGQIGFADPERRVAVGFLRNHGSEWAVSTALVDALYDCL